MYLSVFSDEWGTDIKEAAAAIKKLGLGVYRPARDGKRQKHRVPDRCGVGGA